MRAPHASPTTRSYVSTHEFGLSLFDLRTRRLTALDSTYISTHDFGVSSLSVISPTLDSQVRRPRSYSTDECFLSLSDSRGLRLPWFIPSVLPSTCPHLLQSNEPTHVLVAPCSSSPSPGRCGFIRSSLPSPGQCGLHTLVALLVTAISGSVRPLLLLLLVAASR